MLYPLRKKEVYYLDEVMRYIKGTSILKVMSSDEFKFYDVEPYVHSDDLMELLEKSKKHENPLVLLLIEILFIVDDLDGSMLKRVPEWDEFLRKHNINIGMKKSLSEENAELLGEDLKGQVDERRRILHEMKWDMENLASFILESKLKTLDRPCLNTLVKKVKKHITPKKILDRQLLYFGMNYSDILLFRNNNLKKIVELLSAL